MSLPQTIAQRTFSCDDQAEFAELSGDFNPLHIDPYTSRRLPAGACVVHGVHALLWTLQTLTHFLPMARLQAVDASFLQFLYTDELLELDIEDSNDANAVVALRVESMTIARYDLIFRDILNKGEVFDLSDPLNIFFSKEVRTPIESQWTENHSLQGTVDRFVENHLASQGFPILTTAIGAARVNSILSASRLVGMVVPGLHSVFHRLSVELVAADPETNALSFCVDQRETRHRTFIINIWAPGITGTITASQRPAPTQQLTSSQLSGVVGRKLFIGQTALVVGGSRGLGELTAKILGALGVNVVLTYFSGRADAEAVVSQIVGQGGHAIAIQFDVLNPNLTEMAQLPVFPRTIYYFATPRISGRPESTFSPAKFSKFCDYYVEGFCRVLLSIAALVKTPLRAFYPSTILIGEPARNFAEYAAAKAAGEMLAGYMNCFSKSIFVDVARLPRLPTDQTSGIIASRLDSAVDILLPIVIRNEASVGRSTKLS